VVVVISFIDVCFLTKITKFILIGILVNSTKIEINLEWF
jgi:hypothetical protein